MLSDAPDQLTPFGVRPLPETAGALAAGGGRRGRARLARRARDRAAGRAATAGARRERRARRRAGEPPESAGARRPGERAGGAGRRSARRRGCRLGGAAPLPGRALRRAGPCAHQRGARGPARPPLRSPRAGGAGRAAPRARRRALRAARAAPRTRASASRRCSTRPRPSSRTACRPRPRDERSAACRCSRRWAPTPSNGPACCRGWPRRACWRCSPSGCGGDPRRSPGAPCPRRSLPALARREWRRCWRARCGWRALLALAVVLAGPVGVHRAPPEPGHGLDLVLVIDASGSMRALDADVAGERRSRLALAREVVARFARQRAAEGDRVALVVFGETAFTLCPLTSDGSAALRGARAGRGRRRRRGDRPRRGARARGQARRRRARRPPGGSRCC